MIRKLFFLLFLSLSVCGCLVLSMPYGIPLDAGDTPPDDKVLLIGQFVLDPPVEQGPIAAHAPRGTHKGVIKLYMTYDLRGTYRNAVDDGMDVKFTGLSVVPIASGDHYIRSGSVMTTGVAGGLIKPHRGIVTCTP
jgi:hypothetical protein